MYYMRAGDAGQALYKIDATKKNSTPERLLYTKSLSHANDLTYCSKDGFIYIAPGAGNSHSSMFEGCSSLTSLNLSNFDMGSLKSATSMFDECYNLVELYVPINLEIDIEWPEVKNATFYNPDGNVHEKLPVNLATSLA